MSESQTKAPELEQTSEQQSLKDLIQELHLPDEVIWSIEKITQDKREELILFLQEIQENLKNGEIVSPADATDKARNTLTEYGIISGGTLTQEWISTLNDSTKYNEAFTKLSESLTKVKSLDPVVEDELQKAKEEKPNLPSELTKAVADKTGINIQSLEDIKIKWWEKQQDINNMIDAYYLANIDTVRITELLKWKKSEQEINESFATLRNSARHLDIPVYERARNISKLIPDLTDKKQGQVVDTVTILTKSNPDTIITRSWDTLSWEWAKKWEKYEIDMTVRPPKLSKSLGGLSISYEKQPDNPKLEWLTEEVNAANNSLTEVKSDTQNQLRKGGFNIKLEDYPITELQKFLGNSDVFPNFSERFKDAIKNESGLQVLHTELQTKAILAESQGNTMERKTLSYMQFIVNGKMEQHRTWVGDISIQSEDEKAFMEYIDILTSDSTKDRLEKYITARKDLERKQSELNDIHTPGVEDFNQDASNTLNHLCDIWYDELGQELMDKVIGAVNLKNWWKGYKWEIDLNKNPKLENLQAQELVSALSRLLNANNSSNNFPTNYSDAYRALIGNRVQVQQVLKDYKGNEEVRKHWKNSENLSEYIYSEKPKSDPI